MAKRDSSRGPNKEWLDVQAEAMAPSDNYEGPKDGIRETRKEDWLQYHIYYSFSPERFKEIEPTKEGLFDNFLGEVSGDPSRVLGRYSTFPANLKSLRRM